MPRRAANTLADIESQIEKLQQQAAKLRAAEVKGVIDRIKAAIDHYALTAQQLGVTAAKGAKKLATNSVSEKAAPVAGKKPKVEKPARVAKYGNAEGKTWIGIGKRPGWFVDALAAGQTPEDLLLSKAYAPAA